MSNETQDYEKKKEIFSGLKKEAKALNLKEEVYGILPKKYTDTSDIQVTLNEVDKDPLGDGKGR